MHTENNLKPIKLLLPGIFLLIVGVGNVTVGTFKGEQYQGVVQELILQSPDESSKQVSALERLKNSPQKSTTSALRRRKALARLDFYDLIAAGGKFFIILSAPLLLTGIILRSIEVYQQAKDSETKAPEPTEWRLQ